MQTAQNFSYIGIVANLSGCLTLSLSRESSLRRMFKRSLAGLVKRFRDRLVAKDFMQVFGLDYFGAYAAVTRLSTLPVLLDLKLASLNVELAFLNPD